MPIIEIDHVPEEIRMAQATLAQAVAATECFHGNGATNGEVSSAIMKHVDEQIKAMLPHLLRLPQRVREAWDRLCELGWIGHVTEVYAELPGLRDSVAARLSLVRQARLVVERVVERKESSSSEVDLLRQAENDLLQFQSDTLDRCLSLEDLEDFLANSYPLTNDRLLALADRNPAPTAWLLEEGKPF